MMTPVRQATVRDVISKAFAPMVALQEIMENHKGKVSANDVAEVMGALFRDAERQVERGLREFSGN